MHPAGPCLGESVSRSRLSQPRQLPGAHAEKRSSRQKPCRLRIRNRSQLWSTKGWTRGLMPMCKADFRTPDCLVSTGTVPMQRRKTLPRQRRARRSFWREESRARPRGVRSSQSYRRPRPSRWRRHSRTACRHRLSYLLRAAEQMPVAIFLQRARMIFGNRAEAFNPNPSSPACKFRRRSGPSGRRAKSRGNPFSNASNCIQIRRNADCSWTERPQVLIDMGSRFPSCRPAHAELSYLVRKRPSISPGGTTLTRNHATLPATSYIPISRR